MIRTRAVVAAAAILLSVPSPAASNPAGGCVDKMTWAYGRTRIAARFSVDLPRCWRGKGPYKVRAWIARSEDPTSETVTRSVVRKSCDAAKICRVLVVMDHPATEAATYRLSIDYLRTRDYAVVAHRVLLCSSSPAGTGCHRM